MQKADYLLEQIVSVLMNVVSADAVISCVRALIFSDEEVVLSISRSGVRMKVPPTRRVAGALGVPHYSVLPVFAALEEEGVLVKQERVGVFLTQSGIVRMFSPLSDAEREHLLAVCGPEVVSLLLPGADR